MHACTFDIYYALDYYLLTYLLALSNILLPDEKTPV